MIITVTTDYQIQMLEHLQIWEHYFR